MSISLDPAASSPPGPGPDTCDPAAQRPGRIVFVGNCQLQALLTIYERFVGPWRGEVGAYVDAYQPLTEPGRSAIAHADTIVAQIADRGSRINLEDLPAKAQKYFVPVVAAWFLWPFGGQAHPRQYSRPHSPAGPFHVELGDAYLNRMIAKGVEPSEAIRRYLELDINAIVDLDRLFEVTIERQRHRDAASGFSAAEIICQHFQQEPIFRTPHHAEVRLMRYLATELVRRMHGNAAIIQGIQSHLSVSPFDPDELPIHPSVVRHFKLRYGGNEWKYRFYDQGKISFEEFALRYMTHNRNEALVEEIYLLRKGEDVMTISKVGADLQASPVSPGGRQALSQLLVRGGEHDEALSTARRAVELDPEDPQRLLHLSRLLSRQGDLESAEKALRLAIDIESADADLHDQLTSLLLQRGRPDDALASAKMAVESAPRNSHHRVRVSNLLARLGRLDEAIREIATAIDLDEKNPHLRAHRGRLLIQLGKFPDAEEDLRTAIEIDPTAASFHASLSDALAGQGRLVEAEAELRAAIERDPAASRFHTNLGNLLIRLGRIGEAVDTTRRAVELDHDNPHIRAHLGNLLARQGDLAAAEEALRAAIATAPAIAGFHLNLGNLLVASGDLAGAEKEFRAAVELDPGQAGYHADLGNLLSHLGRIDEAIAALRRAVELDGRNPHVRAHLGNMLAHQGDLAAAEREQRAAIELNPAIARFHDDLSRVLVRLDRIEEAVAASEMASRLEPENEPFCGWLVELRALWAKEQAKAVPFDAGLDNPVTEPANHTAEESVPGHVMAATIESNWAEARQQAEDASVEEAQAWPMTQSAVPVGFESSQRWSGPVRQRPSFWARLLRGASR